MKTPEPPDPIDDMEHVQELLTAARLPPIYDMPRFVTAVQNAVRVYVRARATPDNNAVHHEIRALYFAAWRRRFGEAARRLDKLSAPTRRYINKRAVSLTLPDFAALLDKATRDEAREAILNLLARGGAWEEGRRRGGDRPKRWVPNLCAPTLDEHSPKRQPEHDLLLTLALIYFNATGQPPPLITGYGDRVPFVRLAEVCLNLAGAKGVNVFSILRTAQWRRLSMQDVLRLWQMGRELLWEQLEIDLQRIS